MDQSNAIVFFIFVLLRATAFAPQSSFLRLLAYLQPSTGTAATHAHTHTQPRSSAAQSFDVEFEAQGDDEGEGGSSVKVDGASHLLARCVLGGAPELELGEGGGDAVELRALLLKQRAQLARVPGPGSGSGFGVRV